MSRFDNYIIEDDGDLYRQYRKLQNFNIREAIEDTGKRIVILTNRNKVADDKMYYTARSIKEACDKRKIPNYVLFAENAHILRDKSGNYRIHNRKDKEGFPISPYNTISLSRGSVMKRLSTRNFISQLERANIFCVNSRNCIEICADKYRTALKLAEAKLPSPKTAMIQDIATVEYALEQLGGDFPYIVKTLTGSKGVGVFFAESYRSLKSILQTIWKINENEELIMQEFIDAPNDVRIHVLGDRVVAAMKRFKIENDFRSNYSQGGKVSPFKVNDEIAKVAVKAAKAVGGIWTGIDMIFDKKGNPYIIEINSSPGTEGIERATGAKVVEQVIDFILDENNWRKSPKEVGFKEVVTILDTKIKAKFDTGNGALCVIHADSHEVDEKKKVVKWKMNGNNFEHPYEEIRDVKVGGMRNYTEKRPVIKLDISFDGIKYKDVLFTLDDRLKRTPVLLSRDFMKRANVMVNPADTYLLTIPDEVKK